MEIIGNAYFISAGCSEAISARGTIQPHEYAMRAVEVALTRQCTMCRVGKRAARFHDHSYPRLRELQRSPSGQSVATDFTTCMYLTLVPVLLQQLLITHVAEIRQTMLPFWIQICCTKPTRRRATSRDLCISSLAMIRSLWIF